MDIFSLVIMAAGMGSRYGGLKQLETFEGATLLEYSIYDAIQSGFNHFIFVIQPGMEEMFREKISRKLPKSLRIDYAFQTPTPPRTKPWGTGEAVLAAKPYIKGPFGVINADDYYGPGAFQALADFFEKSSQDLCLVSYALGQTLSAQGGVSRAVCTQDSAGKLLRLEEKKGLHRTVGGPIMDETQAIFPDDTRVSLNCWGLRPYIWDTLEKGFEAFKQAENANLTAEYFLPNALTEWLHASVFHKIKVLSTTERWGGVTFKEDKPLVQAYIKNQYAKKLYPRPLFAQS